MEAAPGFADAQLRGRAGVLNDPAPGRRGTGREGGPRDNLCHLPGWPRRREAGTRSKCTASPAPFNSRQVFILVGFT